MPATLPREDRRVSAWLCRIYLHFRIGPIRCPLCTYVMLFVMLFMLSCRAWPDTLATRIFENSQNFSLWSPPKDTY